MILEDIIRHKRKELKALKTSRPLEGLKKELSRSKISRGPFLKALRKKNGMAVIAEIKRRSPSKGALCWNFEPVRIARSCQKGGAAALSVLTDRKFFGGSPEILTRVKKSVRIPVLRKDFIVDEYQLFESKKMGADAVLFIVRCLSLDELKNFYALAQKIGLEVLFEVHDEVDLKKISPLKPRLVGVNNRDLSSFKVDLNTTRRLARRVPGGALLVSESGIFEAKQLSQLKKWGVKAALVGESLMKEKDPGLALERLLGKTRDSR